jgi:putative DNA primase/helicase
MTPQEALKLGRSIIPCGPEKRPIIDSWKPFQRRLPTARELADWQKLSPVTWGMVTGKVSGIVTLDFDGEPGRRTLKSLGLEPHRRTPSGGFHVDFEHPGWHVATVNGISKPELGRRFPGLDIRGDGGYACFTGRANGGRYTWLRDPEPDKLDLLPADLIREYLGPPMSANGSNGNGHAVANGNGWRAKGAARVARLHADGAGRLIDAALARAGGRNDAGFWLACQLRDGGYTEQEAETIMQTYASRTPDTNTKGQAEPYTEAEAKASVRQAYKRPPREPRKVVVMPNANGPNLLKQLRNDFGNGERLIALHRDNLRYCPAFRQWLVWDGRRWALDDAERARELAHRTMQEFLIQAAKGSHEDFAKFAASSLNSQRITNCLREAQPRLVIRPDELDRDADLLNFQNGTLYLRSGELRKHRQEDYLTKLVNHDYRSDAKCPTFLAFLKKVTSNHSGLMGTAYLQKAFGYSLTGHTIEKAVFFVHGPTDTGKSTLLSLFRSLLGEDYAVLIQIDSIMARHHELSTNAQADLAALRGARFVMTSETEQGQRLSEGQIKRITQGMGRIKATRKYENPIEFAETHKLWIDANHLPTVRDTDDSIWNRLHAIPFDAAIPKAEQDRELPHKLAAEAEGIFAWGVTGAVRWYGEGLGKPKAVEIAAGKWRAQSDQIGRFIEERCETKNGVQVKARTLYLDYRQWAEGAGEHPVAEIQFSQRIGETGRFRKGSTRTGVVYCGLTLRE